MPAGPPRTDATHVDAGAGRGVAVLPFLDLSAARDNEYFSDGLTEELLNVLCSVEGLRVSSRTSCFNLKGKDIDIPTVASRLKVSHVLEGSVRKSGNRVRVTAQLIEAATDSHLWSDTWDRDLDDIFAIQQDIARKIVEALRLRLDARGPAGATTRSSQAYDCYLRGRSFVHRFGPKSLGFAIESFRRATEIDPGYARGWAGLAEAHAIRAIYYDTILQTAAARTRRAAGRSSSRRGSRRRTSPAASRVSRHRRTRPQSTSSSPRSASRHRCSRATTTLAEAAFTRGTCDAHSSSSNAPPPCPRRITTSRC